MDAAGNVSVSKRATVTITLPDTTPPTVSTFTIPSTSTSLTVPITSFTATDNVAVTGYMVTESSSAPSASAGGWSTTAPASYTFTTAGAKNLYAWAKDAAGNVSASMSASVTITLSAPTVTSASPPSGANNVNPMTTVTVTFSKAVNPATVNTSNFALKDASNNPVPGSLVYNTTTYTATLAPASPLANSAVYTATVSGVKDTSGTSMSGIFSWQFSTALPINAGPGGPVLVISSSSNPFSSYYAEILRAEGLNAFAVQDISTVSASTLASYDVVILGQMPLTSAQVTMLTNWVNGGGSLIAMRPDKQLATLLGLKDAQATLSEGYLYALPSGPVNGIVNTPIQFHGTADLYNINGATTVAMLYSSGTQQTTNPAVTLSTVGTGQAAAFTYDLARSIVYLRQGNPAWAGQARDGLTPLRSDDLFYGDYAQDPKPDWVDFNNIAIPQADEQQRLLANLIIQMNSRKRPIPRFWYFPGNNKAVVILTDDAHGLGGVSGRLDHYLALSPSGCNANNWECIRASIYMFPDEPLTDAQAAAYSAQGFEMGLHVYTGNAESSSSCGDWWTQSTLSSFFDSELNTFSTVFPSLPPQNTERLHCVVWDDYTTLPETELAHRIRLDTTYYYYPPAWVNNRPGLFTGSGMPMRFAKTDGTLLDVYQAATQMTDESGQTYPMTINALLNNATGSLGYYGAFTVNAHADAVTSSVGDAVISAAQAYGVPIVSAAQMLTWLDSRNGSTFNSITWDGATLSFSIQVATGTTGLQAMVPISSGLQVSRVTCGGVAVSYTTSTIKGLNYVSFPALPGSYKVTFGVDTAPPTVTSVSPASGATGVTQATTVTAVFSEPISQATISTSTFSLKDASNVSVPAVLTYNGATNTAVLTPSTPLVAGVTYTATVTGGASGVKDFAGNPLSVDYSWSFNTISPSTPFSIWSNLSIPAVVTENDPNQVELGVKFQSSLAGYITGLKFYKGPANTGQHVGHLWTKTGTLLASVTFTNESASGWQQMMFSSPVPITANTTYVASYHTSGYYSADSQYFATNGVINFPLQALANGADGPNGVYLYGAGGFPNQTWNSCNYWVDVVFQQSQ